MAQYIDGFLLPLPKKNLRAYVKTAKFFGKVWLEHGALEYHEFIADDVKKGKITSFPQAVKLKAGEIVVFSWIVYKSRAHRDRVTAKVMTDPRLAEIMNPETMGFDGMRMVWGGFTGIVSM